MALGSGLSGEFQPIGTVALASNNYVPEMDNFQKLGIMKLNIS